MQAYFSLATKVTNQIASAFLLGNFELIGLHLWFYWLKSILLVISSIWRIIFVVFFIKLHISEALGLVNSHCHLKRHQFIYENFQFSVFIMVYLCCSGYRPNSASHLGHFTRDAKGPTAGQHRIRHPQSVEDATEAVIIIF